MEEKHKCKLCARRFGSGRALGGHMRSHFTILPVPPKTQPTPLSGTPSSSSEVSKSPSQIEDSVVLEGESEMESKSLGPSGSRRVGKRSISEWRKLGAIKKSKSKKMSTEQAVSSVSETCSEQDLAMCLMLLSRDKWVRKECPVGKRNQIFLENGTGGDDVKIHECPVCYKVYKSGQALGGHKRSHLFSSTSTAAAHSSDADNVWLIDLNLPAPLEDGGDMSHNQIPVLC